MGVTAIVHEVVKIFSKVSGKHLAFMTWDDNNLVFRKLNGSSLVNIDMSRVHCYYAFILI